MKKKKRAIEEMKKDDDFLREYISENCKNDHMLSDEVNVNRAVFHLKFLIERGYTSHQIIMALLENIKQNTKHMSPEDKFSADVFIKTMTDLSTKNGTSSN